MCRLVAFCVLGLMRGSRSCLLFSMGKSVSQRKGQRSPESSPRSLLRSRVTGQGALRTQSPERGRIVAQEPRRQVWLQQKAQFLLLEDVGWVDLEKPLSNLEVFSL